MSVRVLARLDQEERSAFRNGGALFHAAVSRRDEDDAPEGGLASGLETDQCLCRRLDAAKNWRLWLGGPAEAGRETQELVRHAEFYGAGNSKELAVKRPLQ